MAIIISDIDGTISKVGERVKYLNQDPPNWDSFYKDCFDDEPILPVIRMLNELKHHHYIIFFTGRRENCRAKTEAWIWKYLRWDERTYKLYMRANDDHRDDTEVKPEFIANISNKDDIIFILEDRNCMVQKWRELGYLCLQPAEGNF